MRCRQSAQVSVTVSSAKCRPFPGGGVLWRYRSEHLMFHNKLNHVIVDQAFLILKCVHECFFADPVDHPRDPRRCFMDFIQCFRGKNILPASRIRHMAGDILFRFRTVQMRQRAAHVNPLADNCVTLQFRK